MVNCDMLGERVLRKKWYDPNSPIIKSYGTLEEMATDNWYADIDYVPAELKYYNKLIIMETVTEKEIERVAANIIPLYKKVQEYNPEYFDLDLDVIKKKVSGKKPVLDYELEFVRRITLREFSQMVEKARNYFLTDYSDNMLKYIAQSICHSRKEEIWGEYFEFISKEDVDTKTPYYKLTLFKGELGASLISYVSVITTRYFVKTEEKNGRDEERKTSIDADDSLGRKISNEGVIENPWFELLLSDNADEVWRSEREEMYERIEKAMTKLSRRDQLAISLMVMDEVSCLDAFEDLEPYLNPRTDIPTSEWSVKQKQDAMSLVKGYALKHLIKELGK